MNTHYKVGNYTLCLISVLLILSCDEFVKIDPPRTDLVRATVFTNDATAEAAIVNIYYQLSVTGFANGTSNSIGFYGSISSDEGIFYGTSSVTEFKQFNDNTLQASNFLLDYLWSDIYNIIYKSNAIIEGLATSAGVPDSLKNQLTGEAKFFRAFCHFYSVNLWGDVPLVVTTDYNTNSAIGRTPKALVYEQIIEDLKEAKSLLSDDYSFSSNQRVRVNKGAAIALLARVYLYVEDWTNAEAESTTVINNTAQYSLEPDLTKVFRTSSREAIFQFWSQQYPNDFGTFRIHPSRGPLNGALNPQFATSFEAGDQRAIVWIANIPFAGNTYYGVRKYQSFAIPPDDYSTVLRLSELYLIRGEARAQLNKLSAAASDINIIRNRAGLANTTSANQTDLLNDVMRERQSELFAEWGHRWFDLKRTGRVDVVMGAIKHDWNSTDVLYPIPESQLIIDPAMTQNPN